ncbi:MAG: hypothetical protein LBS19_13795 [Clostridiales bacterium]|jgi:hypothetical protein|nr:hypothetical protein [Clostridiales bacterium]
MAAIFHDMSKDIVFDYRLGYVRTGGTMPGFDVYGDDGAARILTLGGYTTPEQAKSGLAWPALLYERFKNDGRPVQIISGDTDGFTSAQEMLMFIRDGILLRPELVINLSGFYNFAYKLGFVREDERKYVEALQKYPFTNPNQLKYYDDMTSRFELGRGNMYYGEENDVPAWDYWLQHMDIIHCLCNEFNIGHTAVLQPCAFSGGYEPDGDKTADFGSKFKDMYAYASEAVNDRDYIVDLSGLYNAADFEDACHLGEKGLAMLAGEIYKLIASNAAIQGGPGL